VSPSGRERLQGKFGLLSQVVALPDPLDVLLKLLFHGVGESKKTERRRTAAPGAPAKGQTEQHLAAPFGAWPQALPYLKLRGLFARVGRFVEEQLPMLTQGSDCQRAWSGPFVALVAISGVDGIAASARCRSPSSRDATAQGEGPQGKSRRGGRRMRDEREARPLVARFGRAPCRSK
jgi:hypothetical protein